MCEDKNYRADYGAEIGAAIDRQHDAMDAAIRANSWTALARAQEAKLTLMTLYWAQQDTRWIDAGCLRAECERNDWL